MKILLVDDEPMQRELLAGFLSNQGYQTLQAEHGEQALALFEQEAISIVLLDQRMPGLSGEEVLARMKARNPRLRAIMITAFGSVETAVSVLKLGADDFLEKPIDLSALLDRLQRIEQDLAIEQDVEAVFQPPDGRSAAPPLPIDLIAESPAMRDVLSLARRIASSELNVLIHGETGTGKEVIARLIHALSPRAEAPFVELNCAAIPENLFESELFGHEKGAFTGAAKQHRGRFELAARGVLFLDEVGELVLPLQAKLLRALQEKRISRVGSEQDIAVDGRVIAATNRDLRAEVEAGHFREDLYFRLNVLELELPPLRRRREDIPALIEHFIARHGGRSARLAPETLDRLIKYDYPGNIRELEHLLQRMLTLARGPVLRPMDLPPEVREPSKRATGPLQERLDAMERELLRAALERADWVQTQAANELGVSERVLRYKMNKLGLQRPMR
ncbi:two-component system response regulator [Lamprobacter modestohalophilus]|uniref:Two-component system response regulator n=1 Tax=Lamprobacter modestohalophilus TaxID=1064514 RepID=A0A9X1B4Z3_9GAMM|nr:sigma-54 dependent transcriptional regulator [Lamprobacter modestohalophilus]MBK1619995.1 two-component system response regulator [Lamprobacter modestohalophilus]MCF7994594.1 sigma-54 dependent transcriptional regulator [Chromatiaceae bacterium]MCF8014833.1 sigma-54 dependent transcriptional regulator [Chromatiaceae bacterium]